MDIYPVLGKPEPDPELMKIFEQFPHLRGEHRSRLVMALWEVNRQLISEKISGDTSEGVRIITAIFTRWGFSVPNKKTTI